MSNEITINTWWYHSQHQFSVRTLPGIGMRGGMVILWDDDNHECVNVFDDIYEARE